MIKHGVFYQILERCKNLYLHLNWWKGGHCIEMNPLQMSKSSLLAMTTFYWEELFSGIAMVSSFVEPEYASNRNMFFRKKFCHILAANNCTPLHWRGAFPVIIEMFTLITKQKISKWKLICDLCLMICSRFNLILFIDKYRKYRLNAAIAKSLELIINDALHRHYLLKYLVNW